MNEGELEEWALRVVSVRAAINDKAKEHMEENEGQHDAHAEQDATSPNLRSRRGLKLSTKAKHPDHVTEKELQASFRGENGLHKLTKKRRLVDVTVEEQAQIINCYLVKFQRQDDVAVRYQVKPDLVSRLVRQHRADPFFLSKKLQRQHMESTKSEAIVDEVGEMLKTS